MGLRRARGMPARRKLIRRCAVPDVRVGARLPDDKRKPWSGKKAEWLAFYTFVSGRLFQDGAARRSSCHATK
jgi:hypothetical protein